MADKMDAEKAALELWLKRSKMKDDNEVNARDNGKPEPTVDDPEPMGEPRPLPMNEMDMSGGVFGTMKNGVGVIRKTLGLDDDEVPQPRPHTEDGDLDEGTFKKLLKARLQKRFQKTNDLMTKDK